MKLMLSLSVLLLTLLLLGVQLTLTSQDFQLITKLYRSDQAFYLAEAAVIEAQFQLSADPNWRGDRFDVELGSGTYSMRVFEQNGVVNIEAVGKIGKIIERKTIVWGSSE